MTATVKEARNAIMAHLVDQWNAADTTKHIPIEFENTKQGRQKGFDANTSHPKPWARVTTRHATGQQTSLSDETAKKRYRFTGVLAIQIFTPSGDGGKLSDEIADVVMTFFQGKSTSNQVWFRNVRLNEVGASGPWFQANIIADFQYDQVK